MSALLLHLTASKSSLLAYFLLFFVSLDVRPEVLVTPVMNQEIGKCLSALHSVKIMGKIDLMASIQVAQVGAKQVSCALPV